MTDDQHEHEALRTYRERVRAVVDRLKSDLDLWVSEHGGEDVFRRGHGEPNHTEVTAALLETGIDRQIHLHGEKDARELVLSAFDRRAKVLRQQLQ